MPSEFSLIMSDGPVELFAGAITSDPAHQSKLLVTLFVNAKYRYEYFSVGAEKSGCCNSGTLDRRHSHAMAKMGAVYQH